MIHLRRAKLKSHVRPAWHRFESCLAHHFSFVSTLWSAHDSSGGTRWCDRYLDQADCFA